MRGRARSTNSLYSGSSPSSRSWISAGESLRSPWPGVVGGGVEGGAGVARRVAATAGAGDGERVGTGEGGRVAVGGHVGEGGAAVGVCVGIGLAVAEGEGVALGASVGGREVGVAEGEGPFAA